MESTQTSPPAPNRSSGPDVHEAPSGSLPSDRGLLKFVNSAMVIDAHLSRALPHSACAPAALSFLPAGYLGGAVGNPNHPPVGTCCFLYPFSDVQRFAARARSPRSGAAGVRSSM
jgi:hypothetical protein